MTIMRFCRLRNGRTISYREQGSGPPLVLLHGWGMSSALFGPVMQDLARSYRILAPDLPGHGRSDAANDYSVPALCDDLEEWLEVVEVGSIRLLGWSLGGMLAMELARRLESRLERLVLVATTPCFVQKEDWAAGQPAAQVKILARQFRRNAAATLSAFFRRQFEGVALADGAIEALEESLLKTAPPPSPQAAVRALDTLCTTDLRMLDPISVPVLVLHGGRDRIVPPEAGRYLAKRLPRTRWELLDTAGHAPFISHAGLCVRVFEEFLA